MTDPSTDKVEAIEQMIGTIIAVKGEPYYTAVAHGVNVHSLIRLIGEAKELPPSVASAFAVNLVNMLKHACLGLGHPAEDQAWWAGLIKDVESITEKAARK